MGNIFSHKWINGALVAAVSIAVSYVYTWRSDQTLDARRLLIMGVITFIAAFIADLLGDEIIGWLDGD